MQFSGNLDRVKKAKQALRSALTWQAEVAELTDAQCDVIIHAVRTHLGGMVNGTDYDAFRDRARAAIRTAMKGGGK